MRDAFAQEIMDLAEADERVMLLTADLGFGVFERFIERFPDRYVNVGVAEQNLIGLATGLALEGRIVFAYSIGNFPVLRCLEQIRNDAAYHNANVKVVCVGAGFSYGPLGMSHHATEDIALLRAIPEVQVHVPGTRGEARTATRALYETPGTGYLRLDKSAAPEAPESAAARKHGWRVFREGSDVALVAAGGVLEEALLAAEKLESQGIGARVISASKLSPCPSEHVLDALAGVPLVVTIEEHVVRGGLGGLVAEVLSEMPNSPRLIRRGLGEHFVSQVGSQSYLRAQTGIDGESLMKTVVDLSAGPAR